MEYIDGHEFFKDHGKIHPASYWIKPNWLKQVYVCPYCKATWEYTGMKEDFVKGTIPDNSNSEECCKMYLEDKTRMVYPISNEEAYKRWKEKQ